jgi:Rad3-related DNA helicase
MLSIRKCHRLLGNIEDYGREKMWSRDKDQKILRDISERFVEFEKTLLALGAVPTTEEIDSVETILDELKDFKKFVSNYHWMDDMLLNVEYDLNYHPEKWDLLPDD